MKKEEIKLLEDFNDIVNSRINYNQLSKKICFEKYQRNSVKEHRAINKVVFVFGTFIVAVISALVIVMASINKTGEIEKPDEPNQIDGENNLPNNPSLIKPVYNGALKDLFESNIGSGPSYDNNGPMPAPPIIDGYFYDNMDNVLPPDNENPEPNNKPGDENELPVDLNLTTFKYIYEVEYRAIEDEKEYITIYIEKNLAYKIYDECRSIDDAPSASPLNQVNGSITEWFYSHEYYDDEKVFWCQYNDFKQIYSEIEDYICVGVYFTQEREIVREIFSNTTVNIVDNVYKKLYFKNDEKEFLTPITVEIDNEISWYASDVLIDQNNTYFLFDSTYGAKFDCLINIEANTIKLKTYAVQDEDELFKNYSQLLKDYHIWSNSVIVENNDPNKKLGDTTYITYKYKELIEILQFLSQYK